MADTKTLNGAAYEFFMNSLTTGGGAWLVVNAEYSGLSGSTGNAVWRMRNVRIYKEV